VQAEDVVDLAASLMEWEHIRHVPVEDEQGKLVGLVSHRRLLRMLARARKGEPGPVAVKDVMRTHPITVAPGTTTTEAIDLMRTHKVGCLPVVQDDKLVGIVTEHDFIEVSAWLLDRWLREGR
jgi:CBS domain-containing protein